MYRPSAVEVALCLYMYRPSAVVPSTYIGIRSGALCIDRALSFQVRIKVLDVMLFRMICLVLIESNHTTKQTMTGWNKRSDSSNIGIM